MAERRSHHWWTLSNDQKTCFTRTPKAGHSRNWTNGNSVKCKRLLMHLWMVRTTQSTGVGCTIVAFLNSTSATQQQSSWSEAPRGKELNVCQMWRASCIGMFVFLCCIEQVALSASIRCFLTHTKTKTRVKRNGKRATATMPHTTCCLWQTHTDTDGFNEHTLCTQHSHGGRG